MADSAYVAGWEDAGGQWHNVEGGDRVPTEAELATSPRVVIGVEDQDGERHYITDSYVSPDYPIDDIVGDAEGDYGVQFV